MRDRGVVLRSGVAREHHEEIMSAIHYAPEIGTGDVMPMCNRVLVRAHCTHPDVRPALEAAHGGPLALVRSVRLSELVLSASDESAKESVS